jgi:flagellar hook capping protein FlgD
MAFLKRPERWLSLLALLAAFTLHPPRASAQTFWTSDFDISEGDVNETYTPLNNQRGAVVDDSNNLYITFYDNRNKVANDNNFEIYFRKFIFNFGSPYITRVTFASNPSEFPSIATLNWGVGDAATVADSGRIYLAWQDARLFSIPPLNTAPKSFTIFFRTFQSNGGSGFGPEFQVSEYDSVDAATEPVVTVGDSSRVWIVYPKSNNNNADEELYYAIYNSSARTMGAVQPLVVDPLARATQPSIAATRDGNVNLVWTDSRTGKQQIWYKQFVPGVGWSADQEIVFSSGTASTPSISATFDGNLHVVWRDTRDGNSEIYYKEFSPILGWDPVDTRITVNSASQTEPQVDTDPLDNAYVVWTDTRNGTSNPDIYYKNRLLGVWGPETSLVGAGTDTTNSLQRYPTITHDGLGSTYVAWTDARFPASIGKNLEAFYKIGFNNVTGVETSPRETVTRLLRNYPNPFNPSTKVEFTLGSDAAATLRVYDVRGRLVRTLLDSYVAAGRHTVSWDGRDDRGNASASGVYFMRLQAAGQYLTRTVNLVK